MAQSEIFQEQKDDEIQVLKKKHMEDKHRIDALYDKNKYLEEMLQKNQDGKSDEVK